MSMSDVTPDRLEGNAQASSAFGVGLGRPDLESRGVWVVPQTGIRGC